MLLRICRELLSRIRELTVQVRALQRDLRPLVARHAPALLAVPGVGTINAARLLAEVADVRRFRTEAQLALYAGVAPLDASSGRQQRHRLNRSGNRQLNAALHMIALTQARLQRPPANTSPAAAAKARPAAKPCARSSATSSAPSTDCSRLRRTAPRHPSLRGTVAPCIT